VKLKPTGFKPLFKHFPINRNRRKSCAKPMLVDPTQQGIEQGLL
jgi:hypothetical protein